MTMSKLLWVPRSIVIACSIGALTIVCGCGGGGGGSSSSGNNSGGTTLTISGAVAGSGGHVYSGVSVVFDGSANQETTTDATGRFSLIVDSASITGRDSLSVLNSNGSVLDVEGITLTSGQSGNVTKSLTVPDTPPSPAPLSLTKSANPGANSHSIIE